MSKLTNPDNTKYYAAAVALAAFMMPQAAMAQELFGTATSFMASVEAFLNGGFARSVAVIAIIALGLSAAFGKFDMKRAAWSIFGIVLIFGAAAIVGSIETAAGGGAGA